MASAQVAGIAVYPSQGLPATRRRSAHLLAALEEDRTGRQPISFAGSELMGMPPGSESLDNLVHVFLDSSGSSDNTVGYAHVDLTSKTAELTMRPDSFQRVSDLAHGVRSHLGVERFWAKGRESAVAGLEASAIRSLMIMTRDLSVHEPALRPASGVRIRPFNPTSDTDMWLQMNATIFVDIPDQASVTRDKLESLLQEDWFDATGFLVAESDLQPDEGLIGFHWTKVDSAARFQHRVSGEVFVLGVLAQFTGTGLAGALLGSGLRRISSSGVRHVHLYVESNNRRAHSFYETCGFSDADEDQLLEFSS